MTLREAMTTITGVVTLGVGLSAAIVAWAVIAKPTVVMTSLIDASSSQALTVVTRTLYTTLVHVVGYF